MLRGEGWGGGGGGRGRGDYAREMTSKKTCKHGEHGSSCSAGVIWLAYRILRVDIL